MKMQINLPAVPIRFRYKNWHGDDHGYEVLAESIEFTPYPNGEPDPDPADAPDTLDADGQPVEKPNPRKPIWLMHTQVISRDGDPRPEMGPTRRRSFIMSEMRYVQGAVTTPEIGGSDS